VEAYACMRMYVPVPVPALTGLRPFCTFPYSSGCRCTASALQAAGGLTCSGPKDITLTAGCHAQQCSGLCAQAGASRSGSRVCQGASGAAGLLCTGFLCVGVSGCVFFTCCAVCNGLPTVALLCRVFSCAAHLRCYYYILSVCVFFQNRCHQCERRHTHICVCVRVPLDVLPSSLRCCFWVWLHL
jgi:hypothetical protein